MASRIETTQKMMDSGVIAVIRMQDTDKLMHVIDAIYKGGVSCLEITMTVPDAVEMIRTVARKISGDFVLGAGTVLDAQTARAVILAGAEFIVSPVLKTEVIHMAHRYDKAVAPGAFTPTEILTAWEAGADIVKVFPASAGGPKYFKDIKGPLPQVRLTPTGGVSLHNAADFIRAGASCVGIGTALLDKKAIAEEKYEVLTENAKRLVESIRGARSS